MSMKIKSVKDVRPGDVIPMGSLYAAMGEEPDAYTEALAIKVQIVERDGYYRIFTDEDGNTYWLQRSTAVHVEE